MNLQLIPISNVLEDGSIEWGISFSNFNPDDKDFVIMPKDSVFKLIEILTKNSPVAFNSPVSIPCNKVRRVKV